MSKKEYTHIAAVIDRSGSMNDIANDMEGGFDSFIEEQKQVEGEVTVTLALFNDTYEKVHNFSPINEIQPLNLNPSGTTALLDAMGNTMESVCERIDNLDQNEKPEKCIFVFITDGLENASQQYDREQVFSMIDECRDRKDVNFDFVFLGANQDAIQEGGKMNIRAGASMTYDPSSDGIQTAYAALSQSTTEFRCQDMAAFSFNADNDTQEPEEKNTDKSLNQKKQAILDYIDSSVWSK